MWYKKYAESIGFTIDHYMEEVVVKGLEFNKEHFKVRYCPCKLQRLPENVCPCVELRHQGTCTCGLFVKPKE